MTITFVNAATTNLTNTATTRAIDMPTHVAGDWVGVLIAQAAEAGVTWTPPDDWTEVVDSNDDAPEYGFHFAWRIAPTGGLGSTVDFEASVACGCRAVAAAYRGVRSTEPIEVSSTLSVNGASTAPSSPAAETETADTAVLRLITTDDNDAITVPSGTTPRGNIGSPTPTNGSSVAWADSFQSTAGTTGAAEWDIASAEESTTLTLVLAEGGTASNTLELWALWTVSQLRSDVAPGASGWDVAIEETSLQELIEGAMVTVNVPTAQQEDTFNLIVTILIQQLTPVATDLNDYESRTNAGLLNAHMIALESYFLNHPEVAG
jgi:hypothetical protein